MFILKNLMSPKLLKEIKSTKSVSTGRGPGGEEEIIKRVIAGDYSKFVNYFKSVGRDPKIIRFLDGGTAEDRFTYTPSIFIDVKKLHPTQNEIDAKKSLNYPLSEADTAQKYLTGGNIAVADSSILVFRGDMSYIIDGHHRWSQLYVTNPDCSIQCIELKNANIKDPIDVLKSTQMGILSLAKTIPTAPGGGINLFSADENTLKKFVIDMVKGETDITKIFFQYFKDKYPDYTKDLNEQNISQRIADYVWTNIISMRATSKPAAGAPSREIMPQTEPDGTPIKTADIAKKMAGDNPPDITPGGIGTAKTAR